jgi:hypothetical protein
MKKLLIIGLIILAPALLQAQVFINEHFNTFPPTGWTFNSHSTNWHISASENAGGTSPEAIFDWEPSFTNDTTRFISPRMNMTGITLLKVQFKHFVDHYTTPYTVGIATRHANGAWHNVWTLSPTGNVGPAIVSRDVNTVDIGADSFQICWYFKGVSQNIDYWYFDDILLYSPVDHDVRTTDIVMDPQYTAGDPLFIEAAVENMGLNAETFNVNCKIKLGQNTIFDNTQTGVSLEVGASTNVEFPSFTIPTTNTIYDVIICTQLASDMNTSNDTATGIFNTYDTPRDMVVLEIGTGTWCQYCPGAAMGAEDMISHGHNVAVVEYHSGGGGDPFINTYSDARCVYYGVPGYPTAFFDGVLSLVGGNHTQSMYSSYLPLFNERQPIKSAFTISMQANHTGNNYQVQVTVIKKAEIRYHHMALIMALTESNIVYAWQGQTRVYYAERTMSPNQNGTSLDFASSDTQVVNLTFTRTASWIFSELEITAFVQNLDNKEILQGTKAQLDALTTGIEDELVILPQETQLMNNYPNPFNPSTKVAYTLKEPGIVHMDVYNMLGQKVRTLVNGQTDAGEHFAIWDGRDDTGAQSASGTYFVKLNAGNYSSTKKMVLLK